MPSKRLDDLRMVDPVLTTIAQNWKNDLYLSEKIFPIISVNKTKGKFPIFGKEAFMMRDTARAVRAASNRVSSTSYTLGTYETQEHDIEMAIDYLESAEANDYVRYEQKITKDLRDALALNREREIADFVQDPNNFGASQRLILSDADAFNGTNRTGENAVPATTTIKTCIDAMNTNIGRKPNTMIIDNATLNHILENENFLSVCNADNVKHPTILNLAAYLDIEEIIIATGVYSDDGLTLKNIWGDNILLLHLNRSNTPSEYNPSFGYIFQLSGMPEVDTYFENGGKVKVIRCTDNFCWKVTAQNAAYIISNTLA